MPKIKNPGLAGFSTSTAWGELVFDAEGICEIVAEALEPLLTVPGFEAVEAPETPETGGILSDPPAEITAPATVVEVSGTATAPKRRGRPPTKTTPQE
jgi:hypothetical protein